MPGLAIPIGGGYVLGGTRGNAINQSGVATIAQTTYGNQAIQGSSGGVHTWHVVTGSAVASLLFLGVVRHSLPGGMKRTFDLVIIMGAPAAVLYGTVGIWARRRLQYDKDSGVMHGTAKVVKALTP